jgi:hypothetical protein
MGDLPHVQDPVSTQFMIIICTLADAEQQNAGSHLDWHRRIPSAPRGPAGFRLALAETRPWGLVESGEPTR